MTLCFHSGGGLDSFAGDFVTFLKFGSQPFGSKDFRSGGCPDLFAGGLTRMLRSGGLTLMQSPVTVDTHFAVRGGLSKTPNVLDTMEIATSDGPRHFCRVNKNDAWLVKCSAGREARKGVLKRSKVLETLKKKSEPDPSKTP